LLNLKKIGFQKSDKKNKLNETNIKLDRNKHFQRVLNKKIKSTRFFHKLNKKNSSIDLKRKNISKDNEDDFDNDEIEYFDVEKLDDGDNGMATINKKREILLIKDQNMGFGFIAGSEKPLVIRFVSPDGPGHNKLLNGDEILTINDEDVQFASRDYVINLIRNSSDQLKLIVKQPTVNFIIYFKQKIFNLFLIILYSQKVTIHYY